jgi:hypothetical protein
MEEDGREGDAGSYGVRVLGLTVPPSLVATADEMIECPRSGPVRDPPLTNPIEIAVVRHIDKGILTGVTGTCLISI